MQFITIKSFINGTYAKKEGERFLPIEYPATNEKIGEAAVADDAELEEAIQHAQVAQKQRLL